MNLKNAGLLGASLATLGVLFGPSAAQAASLAPTLEAPVTFSSAIVAADNNNNNNNNKKIALAALKPSSLAALAADVG